MLTFQNCFKAKSNNQWQGVWEKKFREYKDSASTSSNSWVKAAQLLSVAQIVGLFQRKH